MGEPRNWKWMVPAFAGWLLLVGSGWLPVTSARLTTGFAVICLLAAVVNLYLYVMDYQSDIYAQVQQARNATPEVRMMEAGKLMHPETAKILLVHRRTIWRIKYIAQRDLVDWILDEAPNVHAGFVDFVLDRSNGSLMPKRYLAEGATKFDPEGVVTDYQQYDELLLLMQQKLMVTGAFGNQAPHFIPPWDVAAVRKRFGLVPEEYDREEMSEAMRRLVEQTPLSPSTATSPQMVERNLGGRNGNGNHAMLEKALDGLQQTSQMKARTDEMLKS